MANTVYSHKAHSEITHNGSYFKSNRIELLSKEILNSFNSYKYGSVFDLALPDVWRETDKGIELSESILPHPQGRGVKSLFSNVAAVYGKDNDGVDVPLRKNLNIPLIDTPEIREDIRRRTDCSIKALVKASESGEMGRAIYTYGDFMYCKYLNKVPNNYMITLRKFPLPCSDHINMSGIEEFTADANKHLPDIGRLVTWLGTPGNEMSNILSYTYSMPWQVNKAAFDEELSGTSGSKGGGALGQLVSAIDGTYGRDLAAAKYGQGAGDNWYAGLAGSANGISIHGDNTGTRNIDLKDTRRVVAERQGAIAEVIVPGGKEGGLTFNHEISLVFDYQLRSYDGINGRSAMLDLLANILMVTYMQGFFFPGSYRTSSMSVSNAYANLDIFKERGYSNPGDLLSSLFSSGKQLAHNLGFERGNILETLKKMGTNMFNILAQGMINMLGRPEQYGTASLITPAATGNWHLTVGNPRNPILSIGNLILDGATIEHYGPLGLDDFPTGLKVTVKLKHARARDSVAIEQMYMQGDYRIYVPMGEDVNRMYEEAKTVERSYNSESKSADTELSIAQKGKMKAEGAVEYVSDMTEKIKNKIYNRHFGTNNMNSIQIAAREALTGARGAEKDKKS